MIIETQTTPDPQVMNFFPPVKILKSGSAEFVDAKSLRKSPLAETLFDLGDIVSIFITPDMISVTKSPEASWEELKPQILAEILDHLATGSDAVTEIHSEKPDQETLIKQIKTLLDARIRPAVKQDGGDIVFKSFDNGTVYVEMRGSCAGCPYALVTLKEGVEKVLKAYIPEVKAVKNFEATERE